MRKNQNRPLRDEAIAKGFIVRPAPEPLSADEMMKRGFLAAAIASYSAPVGVRAR